MNRRSRSPLICPPNRNDRSNLTSDASSTLPSIRCEVADGAPDALRRLKHRRRVHERFTYRRSPVLHAFADAADARLLSDRLPADAIAMMRSPGFWKTWSLRKMEILSRPAFVRVSAIITSPSRTRMPQQ